MRTVLRIVAVVMLLGAGCATSSANDSASGTSQTSAKPVEEKVVEEKTTATTPEERLERYLAEREVCAAARLKELEGTPQAGENYGAEYHCTIKVMAPKYYKEDPEGMTELCVRLYQVSSYTKEGGILGGLTPEELEKQHALGARMGVTVDGAGKLRYDEATSKGWRETCKGLIEFSME